MENKENYQYSDGQIKEIIAFSIHEIPGLYCGEIKRYYNEQQIKVMREYLIQTLKTLPKGQRLLLNWDKNLINDTLFEPIKRYCNEAKEFAIDFELLKEKLDFSNVNFNRADIRHLDFTGSKGVKINPQTVYGRCCWYANFCDTEIVWSFDDCGISGASFKGNKNAGGVLIEPKLVFGGYCDYVDFCDTEIIGSLDDCAIKGASFKGNKNRIKITPQRIKKRDCRYVDFCDTEIIGSFEGCKTKGSSFAGSINTYNEEFKKDIVRKNIRII